MELDPAHDPARALHGHEGILAGLWSAARSSRLAHALAFVGPRGVGKFQAARRLAAGLFCDSMRAGASTAPCGTCAPCRRVRAGSHPDLFVIDVLELPADERPEELTIARFVRRERDDSWKGPTVDEFLALRAVEGGWRVILVREMERANVAAQNSILKMLEEPAELVLWILECSRPADLLPTIRSRCVQVQFEGLDAAAVHAVLAERGIAAPRAERLARWSRGSPGVALLRSAQCALEMRELLEIVQTGEAPPLIAARALWELEGEFDGKTAKAQERARARAFLDLALDVLSDVERAANGATPEGLAHGDIAARADFACVASPILRRRALELLLGLRRDIEANLDPPTLTDRAFLALAPLAAPRQTQR